MGKAAVLYYSPKGNKKANKTKALIVRLGVRLITVSDEDINKTVSELIGSDDIKELDFGTDPAQSAHDGPDPDTDDVPIPGTINEEIMVFFNFTESSFDRILRELKKSHCSVNLKAMVTKTNAVWPFAKLYAQICAERDYIKNNS